jgi:hypothetical protein
VREMMRLAARVVVHVQYPVGWSIVESAIGGLPGRDDAEC